MEAAAEQPLGAAPSPFGQPPQHTHEEFEPRTEAEEGLVLAGAVPAEAVPHATVSDDPTPVELEAAGSIGSSFCVHTRVGQHAAGSGAFLPPHGAHASHQQPGKSASDEQPTPLELEAAGSIGSSFCAHSRAGMHAPGHGAYLPPHDGSAAGQGQQGKSAIDDAAEAARESVAGGGFAGLAVLRQPFRLRGASASGGSSSGKATVGHALQDVYLAGRGALKGLVNRVEEAVGRQHHALNSQPSAPVPSSAPARQSLSDDGRIAVIDDGDHPFYGGARTGRTSSMPADVAAMREAARRLVNQAMESVEDQPKAAAAVAGRMMGMDRYGHTPSHPHTHHKSAPDAPNSPPLTRAGSAVKELREKAQEMRERAQASRRSVTNTPQAAAEMAGRMMGRDNYAPPSRRSAPNTPWPRGSSPLGRPPVAGL